VAARAGQQLEARQVGEVLGSTARKRQLDLGIVTGIAGIPVTAISLAVPEPNGGVTGLLAMLIGWSGLVGINVAHAAQSRGRAT
jgi:hypothetical protein